MHSASTILLFLVANSCFSVKTAYGQEGSGELSSKYDEPEVSREEFQKFKGSIQNITTRLNGLENKFHSMTVSIENNGKHLTELKESLQTISNKYPVVHQISSNSVIEIEKVQEEDDCVTKCIRNDACTSAVWTDSSFSNCKPNSNKPTFMNFTQGEHFYCKDCETNIDFVLEGEDAGVIQLANVAFNKPTQASSSASGKEPSMAVDGKFRTHYSSENLAATKEEPWLMVDLGERYMVAQIRIQVANTRLMKRRGGSFKVCLVDDFDPKINPCNTNTEILEEANRLRSSNIVFDAKRIIMGRYIFLQKINRRDIFEIAELDVLAVFPVVSYICEMCNNKENTVCDNTSIIAPTCQCSDNELFPIEGDATNGCTDPCIGFSKENSVCLPIDFERKSCSCKEGDFEPIDNDACKGCKLKDPCEGFVKENSVCTEVAPGQKKCSCVEGPFFPIDEDPCNGCKDPCRGFNSTNSICVPIDSENHICQCIEYSAPIDVNDICLGCLQKEDPCNNFSANNTKCINVNYDSFFCKCDANYFPIVLGDPCQGCKIKDPCDDFSKENSVCTRGDSGEKKNCSCNEGSFYPVGGDPCNGCKDPCSDFRAKNSACVPIDFKDYYCECEENHSPVILDDPCFGCKLNDPCDGFCKENSVCTRGDSGEKKNCSCNEGSFFPVGGDPCNGCKDPCSGFRAKNSVCLPSDFNSYDCECEENYSPAILNDPCLGCKLNDPCDGFSEENSVCTRGDSGEKKNCSCKKGSFPVGEDPCNGCKDPCSGFRSKNSVCIPSDFKNYDCECEENYFPLILDDACFGCQYNDSCAQFSKENAICIKGVCSCKEGPFYPIGGDPCNGCKDPCRGFDSNNTICVPVDSENHNCGCKDNYAPIDVNDICLGCMKEKACTKSGEISSANHPENYPNFHKDNWMVETGSDCQINIKFTAFSLEEGSSAGCKYDSLTIREGPSATSPILKAICGNEIQPEIFSTNHAFFLEFKTSFFNDFPGFHIIWKEVPV